MYDANTFCCIIPWERNDKDDKKWNLLIVDPLRLQMQSCMNSTSRKCGVQKCAISPTCHYVARAFCNLIAVGVVLNCNFVFLNI